MFNAFLGKRDTAARDGARSMVDWVSSTLDISRTNAADLVYAKKLTRHRHIERRFVDGLISFDRALATLRLAETGADSHTVEASYGLDLNTVSRMTARQRRLERVDEATAFQERYCSAHPTLDESSWMVSGRLPGVEGRVLAKALAQRADEFRDLPGGETSTRAQRQADALVAMAYDSLDRDDTGADSTGPDIAVFVDLDAANGSGGEIGAEVEYGPRVGPNVLDELLCTGTVQVIGLKDGRPVVASNATKAIPPSVRRFVAWRDGGCTIDGCQSRYRLQPHHIIERRYGGSHDPDNLTTLCWYHRWYHHHVAIHRQGLCIDPDSLPQRRRLIRVRRAPTLRGDLCRLTRSQALDPKRRIVPT